MLSFITIVLVIYGLFLISGILFPNDSQWYATVKTPSWAPSGQLIGMVWAFLYACIAVSVAIVYTRTSGFTDIGIGWIAAVTTNYLFNQAYPFFLFKAKNLELAFLDCFAVAATTCWLIIMTLPYSKFAAWLLVPYLVWSCFATLLSWVILQLNRS
ncbi:TspO/MBR family protein [Paenibacillus sp. FJAT-26967]|uniref:TspO/MBR family protein n=1 Tax=Paenibacillus sp. FJAT-26967 TaxID=1729690 RepID=UPI000837C92A|nr:tryptophan-rich sensory protein [Paenibacillus sp. FJAT-26967]